MFLAVDIGNSHTVTGMYDGDKLIGQWRVTSDRRNTADELAVQYHNLLQMADLAKEDIKAVAISSVVPTLQAAWAECCARYFINCPADKIFIARSESINELIGIRLDNPTEVGADRLVNGIAAWQQEPCRQVVIDFGTAITFDCINEKCEYLGGAILPGIAISLEALAGKTAKLPLVDITDRPLAVIGKSTSQAMKSGLLYGYGGMIDGLVAGIKNEMIDTEKERFRVVATGGMAKLIAPYSKSIEKIDPLLTLEGLKIIYQKLIR